MLEQEFCQSCEQRHNCQQLYQQLGETKGPSVVFKVVTAFLLPITVFIAGLVVFEKVLSGFKIGAALHTLFSFLLALSAVFVCMLITKVINTQLSKNK